MSLEFNLIDLHTEEWYFDVMGWKKLPPIDVDILALA